MAKLAEPFVQSGFPAFAHEVGALFAQAKDAWQTVDGEPYLTYEQWAELEQVARRHKVLDVPAVRESLKQVEIGKRHNVPARQLARDWRADVDAKRAYDRALTRQQPKPPDPKPAASAEPPQCPRCDRRMVPLVSGRDGGTFWGCPSFPDCRGRRAS